MTDTITSTQAASCSPPPQSTSPPQTAPMTAQPNPKPKPKPKSKKTRKPRRPRRRGGSSSESEPDDPDGASDSSASDISESEHSSEGSEDEAEEEEVEQALPSQAKESVFGEGKTTAIWDDTSSNRKGEKVEEIEFGKDHDLADNTQTEVRGVKVEPTKGAAGKKERREFTDAEKKRFEEKKAKRKEKMKAKKEEERAEKQKLAKAASGTAGPSTQSDKPAPATSASQTKPAPAAKDNKAKGKGKKTLPNPVQALENATSTLSLDDKPAPAASTSTASAHVPDKTEMASVSAPAPSADSAGVPSTSRPPPHRPSRLNNREAYANRIANDPKFVPRVGGFWTHDQRLYDGVNVGETANSGLRGMSEYWRGRGGRGMDRGGFGGMDRGGFRGMRGRGRGFGPGGFGPHNAYHQSRGQEIASESLKGEKKLEMDKLFEEEEAKRAKVERDRRYSAAEREVLEQPTPPETSAAETADEDGFEVKEAVTEATPKKSDKWGHEAYEAVQAVEAMRGGRGGMRGRGRGRGFAGRGFFPNANRPHLPFAPYNQGRFQPSNAPRPIAPAQENAAPPVEKPSLPKEDQSTQPDAESLLEDSQSVTINIPGSERDAATAVPVVIPPLTTTAPAAAPAADATSTVPTVESDPPSSQEVPSSQPASSAPAVPSPIPPHVTGGSQNSLQRYASIAPSDADSGLSASHFIPPSGYLPPGIGVTPNGEYFNLTTGAPVDLRVGTPPVAPHGRPSQSRPFYPPQPYPPQFYPGQTFSPDFQPRGSFSQSPVFFPPSGPPSAGLPNAYGDGREGTPPPYPFQPSMGYFVPPRSTSKVSIRPAVSKSSNGSKIRANGSEFVPSHSHSQNGQTLTSYPGGYYPGHYNPYLQEGYEGHVQGQSQFVTVNGMVEYPQGGQYWPEGYQGYEYANGAGYGY